MASTMNSDSTAVGWSAAPSDISSHSSQIRGFARIGDRFVVSQQRAWQNESNQLFQQQPRGPPQIAPLYRARRQWQEYPELKILVRGLAPTTTTLDLWQLFHKEGNIDFIRISTEQGSERRTGNASITFKPPPQFDFWTDRNWRMPNLQYGICVLDVSIDPMSSRFRMISSPVNRARRYPVSTTLSPKALGFGIMTGEESMMIKKITVANPIGELLFSVDFGGRSIVVAFNDRELRDGGKTPGQFTRYKFLIRFDELKNMKRIALENNDSALIISLEHPPQFYCQAAHNVRLSHKEGDLMWSERDSWWRATDIVDLDTLADKKVSLSKTEDPVLDMGRWLTYVIPFDDNTLDSAMFKELVDALRDFNIDTIEIQEFQSVPSVPVEVWKMIDRPMDSHSDELHCLMEGAHSFNLPFEVRYQLEVCISQNILEEHSITAEFLQALGDLVVKDKDTAQSILEFLAVRGKRVYDPMTVFEDKDALGHTLRLKIPSYCAYARKAVITPTTMYLSTPTVEISNRVIRKYADYGDRFIRVQFTEENTHRKLPQSADKETNDALYTRVFRTLKNGIRVGDRHYEFLAFGNSQFREHGAYFFSPTQELSCADIRRWMGNFTSIRNPAKYAARLGQCFSTTRAMKNRKIFVSTIPDVERNGYCFTDGVGKISSFLMKLIQEELRLPEEPSIVQFRMGGCKGVLAVWPDLKAYEVQIRKSQNKFPAEYNGLEIIRASQFSFATLNRQTITILSSLGVADDIFVRKLEEQLANYQEAVTNPEKADELLRRYIDEQYSTMAIAAMVHNGFMRSGDPFVNSLLHLWRSWSIKYLKEKAKIIVEKGAFVFGCTDETQTLRGHTDIKGCSTSDGKSSPQPLEIDQLPQIFLQVTDPNDPKHTTVIEGLCLVGRNPSLHPGDIRVVQAIDVPALHHLKDVVVFSQLGDRDVPGMCSGGDLDGDDFFVIWDKDFIPKEWNAEPMVQPESTKNDLRRPVEMRDVMGFFVTYMKNDTLGQIANAHLAQADIQPNSVKSPICNELAALHSNAVDYVKSGVRAVIPKDLRPKQWPHFMEKERGVYRSIRVVGQLYDRVVLADFQPQWEMPFDQRVLSAYPEDKEILKRARQLKTQYDSAMLRIMAQYGIETEFEIWTSFLMSKATGMNPYQMERQMAEVSDALKDKFRTACVDAAGGSDFKTLAPFVAAMYKVTSEEMEFALKECKMFKTVGGRQVPKREMKPKTMPLISFPWLFPDKLGRIATNSEPYDLLGLGLDAVQPKKTRPKKVESTGVDVQEPEDIIQTADGVVHRGELLDLFHEVEHSDDEDEMQEPLPLPIRSRNLQDMASDMEEDDSLPRASGTESSMTDRRPSLIDIDENEDVEQVETPSDARRPSLIDIDEDEQVKTPPDVRRPSLIDIDEDEQVKTPPDVRRPSLIRFDEDGEAEATQLVETDASQISRKGSTSIALSAVDDLAEMNRNGALDDLHGLEEPITEEDWEMLANVQAKASSTPKQSAERNDKVASFSSTLMTMEEFDKLPVVEVERSAPAKKKKWSSTTSDSEGLLFGAPFQPLQPPQTPQQTMSNRLPSTTLGASSRQSSSAPTPSAAILTPKAATKSDLDLPLESAAVTPKPPATPILAPVYSKVILEEMDSLPSPELPVRKGKAAARDTESKKKPFFAAKPSKMPPIAGPGPKKEVRKKPSVVLEKAEDDDLLDWKAAEVKIVESGVVEESPLEKLMKMTGDIEFEL